MKKCQKKFFSEIFTISDDVVSSRSKKHFQEVFWRLLQNSITFSVNLRFIFVLNQQMAFKRCCNFYPFSPFYIKMKQKQANKCKTSVQHPFPSQNIQHMSIALQFSSKLFSDWFSYSRLSRLFFVLNQFSIRFNLTLY